MTRFKVENLPIGGLKKIIRSPLQDSRGILTRVFCSEELHEAGWMNPVVQVNQSITYQCGTVRGMHFQKPPNAEMKLVTCIRGKIWDVVVDLRSGSRQYLKWHAEILSAENNTALVIPEGCAHGFQTLSDNVELLYLHSAAYAEYSEGAINPKDPNVGISWPLPITELSPKDSNSPLITTKFRGFEI